MPLYGIRGYHTPSVNQLIAAVDNDMINVTTGLGYGVNLTLTNNVEFENFLQRLFFQNFNNTPLTFDGIRWTRQHVGKLPIAKYLRAWKERMYLAYVQIRGTDYSSRVMYPDLPINDTIVWGYETGTNLVTRAGSPRVTSALAGFKGYNIKRGDPFFILSGSDAGQYSVKTIVSDLWLDLADYNGNDVNLTTTATGVSYWVGSNWFDVERDDGDFITWIDVNQNIDNLLIFKRESLFRYDGTRRVRVKGLQPYMNLSGLLNYPRRKGYKLTNEHKIKLSITKKNKYSKDYYRERGLKGLVKQQNMKEPTSLEKAVYDYLLLKGILFEKQKLVNGKFIVDAYIPALNLIIEADGKYWHSLDRVRKKDKAENAYLIKCGFKLLRLNEEEIKSGEFKERLVV